MTGNDHSIHNLTSLACFGLLGGNRGTRNKPTQAMGGDVGVGWGVNMTEHHRNLCLPEDWGGSQSPAGSWPPEGDPCWRRCAAASVCACSWRWGRPRPGAEPRWPSPRPRTRRDGRPGLRLYPSHHTKSMGLYINVYYTRKKYSSTSTLVCAVKHTLTDTRGSSEHTEWPRHTGHGCPNDSHML